MCVTKEISKKLSALSTECACIEGRCSLPDHDADRMALVFKALSDPVRFRIYHFIASNNGGSVCTCHMPEIFGITQPTLSYHLKRLVKAGLVTREMQGKWAHFSIATHSVGQIQTFLDDVLAAAHQPELESVI